MATRVLNLPIHPISASHMSYIAMLRPSPSPFNTLYSEFNTHSLSTIASSYSNLLDMLSEAEPFSIDIHTQESNAFDTNRPFPHIHAGLYGFTFKATPQEADRIASHELVDFVEMDQPVVINQERIGVLTQHDPPSWGLDRIDERETRNDSMYTFPANSGANVTVYVVDTGVQVNSSEFVSNNQTRAYWGTSVLHDTDGAKYDDSDAPVNNTDQNGHGTFVASIIGSNTYGVAKNCTIIAVQALNSEGRGSTSGVVRALQWIVGSWNSTRNASIINISADSPTSRALNTAANAVVSLGIPIVVAAGNSGTDACQYSPASAVAAITVGATDIHDRIAKFSNFGPCVDMFAPGVNVTSLSLIGTSRSGSGTSFSAPYVTGSLANYWGMNASQSATEVMDAFGSNSTQNVVNGINWFSSTPNRFVYSLPPQVVPSTDP
ncbi:hypothetical protein SeMB42_g07515 [Synchytrium endobioticum]|uniref:Peptidase S8/S53 domain-containing protein n=1 Tax=Synchytrium endobioticum TaxID=286115 RepID=A0A507BWD2_9FUNG|nr:hypothetical protein SeMB42_g07515 [Synchytrium endobioticum]TPX41791.1 hypothetical protein SeLEV6574_g05924 [Synchytrium endobioticum]